MGRYHKAMHFLLFYTFVPDVLEKRPKFRGTHLAHARAAVERGELKLAGAFDPVDGAALLFSAPSKAVPEEFARADPYVTGGLVTKWEIRQWTTVVGENPAHPLPPGLQRPGHLTPVDNETRLAGGPRNH